MRRMKGKANGGSMDRDRRGWDHKREDRRGDSNPAKKMRFGFVNNGPVGRMVRVNGARVFVIRK